MDCVRIPPQTGTSHMLADVKVEDPGFAKLLCSKLLSKNSLAAEVSQLEAFPTPAGLLSGSNARRVECKKVQCSWYKPSKTAWLNFGNEAITKRVLNKFNSKFYKVFNQTTHCSLPPRGGGGRRNPHLWTIMLTDLPAKTTETDIRSAISAPYDNPRNIELGEPSYEVDGELASATVMSLLTQAGPIEWSQVNTELEGKRAKAVARFYEEADARAAAKSLHDYPLPFGPNLRLTIGLVSTAKFKVATNIFRAVQPRIFAASQIWKTQHLTFKIYPSVGLGQQDRILKIEGQVANDVAMAKETMDRILDGVTVMSQGKPLWTPSLNNNGNAFQKLKQIQQDHNVVIMRNRRKAELKLYGSDENCLNAESAIASVVNAESSSIYSIKLNSEDFRWACSGGFKTIVTALGEDIATFDIVSTPKRILISGSDKEHETASRMVRKREMKLLGGVAAAKEDCAVCWTRAENPVFTKCNHVYCIECFEGLCSAAVSGDNESPVTCTGDGGECPEIFSLRELQESLSSKVFEEILEASFVSHIKRHPQTFRYCPKPDCGIIYRTTSDPAFNTCAKCLTVTCTHCHNTHEGKTCAEYKDEASGGYEALKRAKMELGIKDCPKCETPIEKIDGCNHMTCRGCGTHICWVCLMTFLGSTACYDHMKAEHGGIGLDYLHEF